MEMFYLKNRTIQAKKEIGKYDTISEIWKHNFSPSNKIGNVTNLFVKLDPKTEKDFCDKYFRYAEEHKVLPISQRGLTYDEFVELVKKYMTMGNEASGMNFPYETYFNDALCHIITETYDGKIIELRFMRYLTSLGYDCDCFEGHIDARYGVDIKITRKSDGQTSAIQIKPITFFKAKRSDTHADRIQLIHKYHDFIRDYKMETDYAIYVKAENTGNIFWLKNSNGFIFKIKDLFDYDPNDIDNTAKSKYLKRDFHYLDF